MTHEQTVLVTLVAYELVLVGIGLLARQRTHDGLDFFLGARQLGPTVAALSSAASSSSAWTLLGVSGAAYSWGLGALWLFGIGIGYPGQPHVINRYMALKKGRSILRRARVIGIGWAVVVYAGMLLLGLCGRVLYPNLADAEVVLVVAAHGLLPAVVAGVMIAAVLSAIMSTADSQLLVAASSITHDLEIGRSGSWNLLSRSRLVVLLLSSGAVVAALYGSQEIFSRVLFAWAAMGSAFAPLILLTVWRGPVSVRATLAAMTTGFLLSVTAYSLPASHWKDVFEHIVPWVLAFVLAVSLGGIRWRRRGWRGW